MGIFLWLLAGLIGALWFRWAWCKEEKLDFYNPSPVGIVLILLGMVLGPLMIAITAVTLLVHAYADMDWNKSWICRGIFKDKE